MFKPHRWLIALAGPFVPRRLRDEWRQEWIGELRHREAVLERWPVKRGRWDLFRRSLGALHDVLWLQPRRLEEDFVQDVRYGLRLFVQQKTWTAVAVLSLALGIGANTAIFSVADEVLLKTLPVKNPHELVLFQWTSGRRLMGNNFSPGISIDDTTGAASGRAFSHLMFERFRAGTRTLSGVLAFTTMFQDQPSNEDPDPPVGQLVSGNYYAVLGVPAAIGRTLTIDDDADGAVPVAMISDRFWTRRFGRDPAVVGRSIVVGSTPVTIVGVTPAGFSGTQDVGRSPDLTLPLSMAPRAGAVVGKFAARMKTQAFVWTLMIMGRLRPESTPDQARAELQPVFQAAGAEGWHGSPRAKTAKLPPDTPTLQVEPGAKGLADARRSLTRAVFVMTAISALVLLIVCANLVNLLLARAAARRQETAVRLALGAGRGRLVRQLLTESVLLAAVSAALGTAFALWTKDLYLAWIARISPSIAIEPHLDLRVLAFTSAVALIVGLAVGVAPSLAATRVDIQPAIAGGARGDARPRSIVSRALLVAQVALSIVLLVGAGLFVRTLVNLQRADVGFNARSVLVFDVSPRPDRHAAAGLASLYQRMLDRIQAVPGVRAATNSGAPLLVGDLAEPFIVVPGRTRPADESGAVHDRIVWHNFFETMEMPLVAGRGLLERDRTDKPVHVVVNETLARKYFPAGAAVGRRIGMTKAIDGPVPEEDLMEIVGVARDARVTTVRDAPPPTIFRPFQPMAVAFEVRTAGDPKLLVASIRAAVREVDADIVLRDFRTQSELAELTYARERHFAILASLSGLLALVVACIGLYGLMSYDVANRTREIGIRMALGAARVTVIRHVLRDVLRLVAAGTLLGLGLAVGLTRFIASLLFGLSPADGPTIAIAVGLMFVVAALAAFVPARRASSVNPVVALRYE